MGFSSTWWVQQHNRHHAMPQRWQYDVDLNTTPLVAYNTKVIKNSEEGKGFMIQNQVSVVSANSLQILCIYFFSNYKGLSVRFDRHILDRCIMEVVSSS